MTKKRESTGRRNRGPDRTAATPSVAVATVTDARKRFPLLIDFVEQGNVVQVTRYGKPFLYLVPSKLYRRLRARDHAREKAASRALKSKSRRNTK